MITISVNETLFAFEDSTLYEEVILELLKRIEFSKLTVVRPANLMYLKNKRLIKYEELIKQTVASGDEISMLAILSGG